MKPTTSKPQKATKPHAKTPASGGRFTRDPKTGALSDALKAAAPSFAPGGPTPANSDASAEEIQFEKTSKGGK